RAERMASLFACRCAAVGRRFILMSQLSRGFRSVRIQCLHVLLGGCLTWIVGCASAPNVVPRALPAAKAPEPKPPPPAAPAPVNEDGPGLSSEQVSSVVRGRSLAVGGCHAVEFSGKEPLAGFVVLDLTINSGGKVMHAHISESSYARAALTDCVVGVARGLTFPAAHGNTEISWRFDFQGRQASNY